MLEEGLSVFESVYTFISGNDIFKVVLGIAVGGIGISAFLGLFFRR